MNNPDISLKHALTAVRKTTLIMAIFAAVFILAAFRAHASDTVLTVQKDGVTVKEFSQKELQDIATEEGNKTYSYSAWSNEPEFRMYTGISGPTVKGVLTEADNIFAEITDKCVVSFSADRTVSLTGKQLINETRYFYPNGDAVDHAAGIVPETSKNGAVECPAVISIENGLLCVGQTGPSEENDELFLEGLIDPEKHGVINISTSDAPKCKSVKLLDLKAGSLVFDGTEVTLDTPEPDEKICYTTDKNTSPGFGCPIYNYGSDKFCKPLLCGDNVQVIVKFRVKGYGKQDSSLQTYAFSVGDALRITIDGETVKSYHLPEDVAAISEAETYTYSGYNTFPNIKSKENVEGIPVKKIVKDATGKDVSEFSGSGTIRFTGTDGYTAVFTFDQLFGSERYFYPNASSATDRKGGAAGADAYEDKQPVPAIIDLSDNNTLMVGQIAPNEQSWPQCVDYMLNLGCIDIVTAPAEKLSAPSPKTASGSVVKPGTAIRFPFPSDENKRDKLYYIVDPAPGEIPGPGDAFYYYAANSWPEELVNPPVLDKNGKHTISLVLTSYGKLDSPVMTLTYYVTPEVGKPAVKLKAGKKRITVKWSKAANANGYVIYRSTKKSSGYKLIKTIKNGNTVSFVNKKLSKGRKYYYKVRAFRTVGDKNIYGSYSAVKYKKAK